MVLFKRPEYKCIFQAEHKRILGEGQNSLREEINRHSTIVVNFFGYRTMKNILYGIVTDAVYTRTYMGVIFY